MDFETVIEKILTAFEKAGIRYALMGGGRSGLPSCLPFGITEDARTV